MPTSEHFNPTPMPKTTFVFAALLILLGVGAFAVADAAAIAETATLDKGRIAAIREAFEAARQFVAANPV